MAFDNDDFYFPRTKPLPVRDGLKTKKRNGAIGEQWWSKRFIQVLESFGLDSRLARGRAYARKGQVVSLDIDTGLAIASVQGSRRAPYNVVIRVPQLTDEDWTRVQSIFARRAAFLARLLAGEVPEDIESAFSECSLSLFPRSRKELEMACSCPDDANPCKHAAAALYLLAERFDEDPFLVLHWRGRSKQQILEAIGSSSSSLAAPGEIDDLPWANVGDGPALTEIIDSFWTAGPELNRVRPNTSPSPHPDVLLRQLGPLPESLGGATATEYIRQSIMQAASGASPE